MRIRGSFFFVPDAPGADALVGVALHEDRPVGVAVLGDAPGLEVRGVPYYDATRSLGHVSLDGAPAVLLDAPSASLAGAWHLAQALVAAESLGAAESALDAAVAYARRASHLRPRDRLLPGHQARAHGGPAPARERPLAALLCRLVARRRPQSVPPRRQRRPLGRRPGSGPRRPHDDRRPRRDRRDLGARRPPLFPPRAGLRAVCSGARPVPATASPASCSRQPEPSAGSGGRAGS